MSLEGGTMKKKRKILWILTIMLLSGILMLSNVLAVEAYTPRVKISYSSVKLKAGKTKTIYLRGTTQKVTWKSSKSSVVSVTDNGKIVSTTSKATIKAKKAGTATITAIAGGKKYTCKVTVEALPISMSKKTLSLKVGETSQLSLKNATAKVTWKSSKSSVAKVSSKGKVTAKKAGTATITAVTGGKKYTCKVTVKKPTVVKYTGTSNLKKVRTYLKNNGKMNEDGDFYIQMNSGKDVYRITYDVNDDKIKFYAYLKKWLLTVNMSVSIPNKYASFHILGPKTNPYGIGSSIPSYNYKKTYVMPPIPYATAYEQSAATVGVRDGFAGWNTLLKKKTGFQMKDIGFASYK